jgi:tripartite-type tricarboxylate transporter receptor subunit TctC
MTNLILNRRKFMQVAAASGAATLAIPAWAQGFPNGSITLLVGFSAGGLTDTVARLVGQVIQDRLGVPVVVVNKPGAAGGLALRELASANPNGQTIMVSSVGQIAVLPHTSKEITIDPRTEIDHVSLIGEGDFVFTVHSSLPVHNMDELKAYMAENPGSLLYGTSGAGGNLHLATELFLELAGLEMEGIHYPGSSTLMPDLLNNQIQFAVNVYPAVAQYIQDGTLRPILATGRERIADLPDVAASTEVGMDLLAECRNWFGLHAPLGTPPEVIATLNEAVRAATESDLLVDRLTSAGLTPRSTTPEEFTAQVARDYELYGEIAEQAGLAG